MGVPPPLHGKFLCRGFFNPSLTIPRRLYLLQAKVLALKFLSPHFDFYESLKQRNPTPLLLALYLSYAQEIPHDSFSFETIKHQEAEGVREGKGHL